MKPTVQLIGQDGNVFNLIGLSVKALKKAGLKDQATELTNKCFEAEDYNQVLNIINEYLEVE
jgi:hypothetical protein